MVAATRVDVRVEYHVRFLERHGPPSRLSKVAQRIAEMVQSISGDIVLLLDITAVGMPATRKILSAAKDETGARRSFRGAAINITGVAGGLSHSSDGAYMLPRRDLITDAQGAFEEERLKIADELPLASTLREELLAFKDTKANRNPDSLEGWREGHADDLVLAAAMAVWGGERFLVAPEYVVLPERGP